MNVYDFDGTIYNGDSTVDFYFYCLKKDFSLIRFIPQQCVAFFLYFFGQIDKTKLKERFFCFLLGVSDVEEIVDEFWLKNESKIFEWYKKQSQSSDIVISASPYFLLKPICDRLKIGDLIASKVDVTTGCFDGPNCHDKEKVRLFKAAYPNEIIEEFYSNSLSDYPMAEIAERAFMVKRGIIKPWPLR